MPRKTTSISKTTPPKTTRTRSTTRATSTKAKTPKAPVLKKAEIEAMLLSAQKKLHDAEVTLEAQTEELTELRARVTTQGSELTEVRDMYYGGQVDIRLAQHQRNKAQAAARTATAEMRHLTQLLAEAELQANEARAAQSKTSQSELDAALQQVAELKMQLSTQQAATDANKQAADAQKQISDLKAKLTMAETTAKKADTLRKRVSEQDQQLEARKREIADLTALLNESEGHQHGDLQAQALAAAYGRAAVGALITPPDTMRLDQERLNRAAQALAASDAFDAEWYLETNGDVAESGVDPALHFLEFGFAEGRGPRATE